MDAKDTKIRGSTTANRSMKCDGIKLIIYLNIFDYRRTAALTNVAAMNIAYTTELKASPAVMALFSTWTSRVVKFAIQLMIKFNLL